MSTTFGSDLKLKKDNETTVIEIQSQHWGGNRQLSMEGIAVDYDPNSIDLGRKEYNMN